MIITAVFLVGVAVGGLVTACAIAAARLARP